MKSAIAVAVAILALVSTCAACTTVFRSRTIDSGKAKVIAVDAKQRFLVSMPPGTATETSAAPSGSTTITRAMLRKVCTEPSPDVFSVLSASMEGSVKYKDKASADFKAALSEAAATIGIRTARRRSSTRTRRSGASSKSRRT